jgi:hypothetical protein
MMGKADAVVFVKPFPVRTAVPHGIVHRPQLLRVDDGGGYDAGY